MACYQPFQLAKYIVYKYLSHAYCSTRNINKTPRISLSNNVFHLIRNSPDCSDSSRSGNNFLVSRSIILLTLSHSFFVSFFLLSHIFDTKAHYKIKNIILSSKNFSKYSTKSGKVSYFLNSFRFRQDLGRSTTTKKREGKSEQHSNRINNNK